MIPREILKKIRQIEIRTNRIVTGMFFAALLMCSCVTRPDKCAAIVSPALPPEVAVRYADDLVSHLFVTLRFDDGEDLPFALDTGLGMTLLPKSLESKLGKRLGTKTFDSFGEKEKKGIYAAPKLYLNNTPLRTGNRVATEDRPNGILGMDCLRHYCIQLDFQSGKLRFLDPENLDTINLGKPFSLTSSSIAGTMHGGLLGGRNAELMIDTGDQFDAVVEPGIFQREFLKQKPKSIPFWKNGVIKNEDSGIACFSECVWEGYAYTNLVIQAGRPNLIGLRFLARHLVTFNFPKHMMYLKQMNVGPVGKPIEKPKAL